MGFLVFGIVIVQLCEALSAWRLRNTDLCVDIYLDYCSLQDEASISQMHHEILQECGLVWTVRGEDRCKCG